MDFSLFVNDCINDATNLRSKVSPEVMAIQGWSSPKQRHLLNNLVSMENARYLEIGVWKGATHVAALYGNTPEVSLAVDDFSENWNVSGYPILDGKVADGLAAFESNCQQYLGSVPPLFNGDFLDVPLEPASYNLYFYDGGHSEDAQARAITHFWPALMDEALILVDDWNWEAVSTGTRRGLAEVGANVVQEWILPANIVGDMQEWWNGLALFLIRKE